MQMAQEESARLLQMEDELKKHIIGQDEAIEAISKSVRRARSGLKDPRRPIGSFIFLGPTGVGKDGTHQNAGQCSCLAAKRTSSN
jgi:ATP-dependent Clp protease ATP-binding subunit ClpC